MKKFLILFLIFTFTLSACSCEHEWIDANCHNPKKCEKCDKTEGEPIEHKWIDATCEESVTCELCGDTAGNPLGHKWINATCTKAKTCSICNKTEGEPIGHNWIDATYSSPKKCSTCGTTEGTALVNPTSIFIGIYQTTYIRGLSTISESLQFYADGTVIQRCSVNETDGYGQWSLNGDVVNFSLYHDGADHTDYCSATIVNGGLMWGSLYYTKMN